MSEIVIVGAVDTETANMAVDRAAHVAAALGAKLVVVTAYGDDDVEEVGVGSDTYLISTAEVADSFAEQTAARLRATHSIECVAVAQRGKPDDVILDTAKRFEATLIVVGNVRMQGAARLFGSVGNDVTHHAPCDVLVVKTS